MAARAVCVNHKMTKGGRSKKALSLMLLPIMKEPLLETFKDLWGAKV
jgi:hypothetical protein